MKVKLCFASQFIGAADRIIEVPDGSSDRYIKSLFPTELGVLYNKDCCWYEIIEEKI